MNAKQFKYCEQTVVLNSLLDNKTIKADLCYLDGETTVCYYFSWTVLNW